MTTDFRQLMPLSLEISDWEDCSGDGSYLLATVTLAGVHHHLEAIRVRNTRNGLVGATSQADQLLKEYYEADGGTIEGRFSTVKINNRLYCFFMIPGRGR